MGTTLSFTCPQCRYEASVSGGPDAGFFCNTLTVRCMDCRALYDVVTFEDRGQPTERRVEPRCPKSQTHTVEPWTHPGPCPRCGVTMEEGGEVALWDYEQRGQPGSTNLYWTACPFAPV